MSLFRPCFPSANVNATTSNPPTVAQSISCATQHCSGIGLFFPPRKAAEPGFTQRPAPADKVARTAERARARMTPLLACRTQPKVHNLFVEDIDALAADYMAQIEDKMTARPHTDDDDSAARHPMSGRFAGAITAAPWALAQMSAVGASLMNMGRLISA